MVRNGEVMPNALKIDPTRTTLIRRQFVAEMVRRFKRMQLDVIQALADADALGLIPNKSFLTLHVGQQAWASMANPQKVASFRRWLGQRMNANLLEVSRATGKPWTAKYIEASYRRGAMRAYIDSKKDVLAKSGIFGGEKSDFLKSAFTSQIDLSRVEMLYERAFTELEGITSVMDQQMSRILADGLVSGISPRAMAVDMNKQIAKLTNTRAKTIARTEVIRAHAEGQLDSFDRLGIEKLHVRAEWSTAGDDIVCEICSGYEGEVFEVKDAHGLIPQHPNCFVDGQIPIYTSKGWVHIKDIKVGMLVLTHKKRFRKVTELMRTPKQRPNIVRIYLKNVNRNFSTLTVTEDHPIMLGGVWVAAKEAEAGMTVSYLASKCKRCEKLIPHYRIYCSDRCRSLNITDKQWASEDHRKNMSEKARAQMNNEYKYGVRIGSKITEAAHKVTKQMAKDGNCPLSRPDVRDKIRECTNTEEFRAESSFRMMLDNPMSDPETVKRASISMKKFFLEHPEKHPNVIMSKKGFISSLEKKMKSILEEMKQDFVHQFPIDRYFADFVLPKYKIVIEVDGNYWHQDKLKDDQRQKEIESLGWMVIRFDEDELKNESNVKKELQRVLMNHDGEYNTLEMKILRVEKRGLNSNRMLYNFSVEEDESYIAKGFVVHNCRCMWLPADVGEKRTASGRAIGSKEEEFGKSSFGTKALKGTKIAKDKAGKLKKSVSKKVKKSTVKQIDLTKKEKFAIEDYTSDKFLGLNSKLRAGKKLSVSDKNLLESLQKGLNKLPTYEKNVFRKVSFNSEADLNAFLRTHKPGSVITYKTPLSTSSDNRRFLFSGKGDVNITIKNIKSGKDISLYSKNPTEKEILFGRNKSFKILEIKKNDLNAYDIVLEEI